jgi:hypothetical protein
MGKRRLVLRQTGLNLLVWCTVLSGLSCGGDSNEPSTTPTLRITVTTSGSFLDADGYEISMDRTGCSASPCVWLYQVEATGAVQIADLTPGYYNLQLVGLAPNCVVEGGDRRTLEVPAGVVTRVAFTVSCVTPAHFSTLVIGTVSVGAGSDPDGYTVRVDHGDWQAIGIGETLTVPSLAPGVHSVFLGGLASHCDVIFGDNPLNVTIDAYPMVTASFTVYCGHNPAPYPE